MSDIEEALKWADDLGAGPFLGTGDYYQYGQSLAAEVRRLHEELNKSREINSEMAMTWQPPEAYEAVWKENRRLESNLAEVERERDHYINYSYYDNCVSRCAALQEEIERLKAEKDYDGKEVLSNQLKAMEEKCAGLAAALGPAVAGSCCENMRGRSVGHTMICLSLDALKDAAPVLSSIKAEAVWGEIIVIKNQLVLGWQKTDYYSDPITKGQARTRWMFYDWLVDRAAALRKEGK